jgi:hypothetical protein
MIRLSRRTLALSLFAAALAVLPSLPAGAQSKVNVDAAKVAIKGYDPVAYFTEQRAVRGKPEFETAWQDAVWRFASAENRDRFRAEPEKYSPRYGGFCALGIAKGARFDINPEAWSIVEGKLYLNYDTGIRQEWRQKSADYIREADRKWAGVN